MMMKAIHQIAKEIGISSSTIVDALKNASLKESDSGLSPWDLSALSRVDEDDVYAILRKAGFSFKLPPKIKLGKGAANSGDVSPSVRSANKGKKKKKKKVSGKNQSSQMNQETLVLPRDIEQFFDGLTPMERHALSFLALMGGNLASKKLYYLLGIIDHEWGAKAENHYLDEIEFITSKVLIREKLVKKDLYHQLCVSAIIRDSLTPLLFKRGLSKQYLDALKKFELMGKTSKRELEYQFLFEADIQLRLMALSNQVDELLSFAKLYPWAHYSKGFHPVARALIDTTDPNFERHFHPSIRFYANLIRLFELRIRGEDFREQLLKVTKSIEHAKDLPWEDADELLEVGILFGEFELVTKAIPSFPHDYRPFAITMVSFIKGGASAGNLVADLSEAITSLRRNKNVRNDARYFHPVLFWICFLIMAESEGKQRSKIYNWLIKPHMSGNGLPAYVFIPLYLLDRKEGTKSVKAELPTHIIPKHILENLLLLSAVAHCGELEGAALDLHLKATKEQDLPLIYQGLKPEFSALMEHFGVTDHHFGPPSKDPWFKKIELPELWEAALSAMERLAGTGESEGVASVKQEKRLAWRIMISHSGDRLEVAAVEQKLGKKGNWSKGRTLSWNSAIDRAGEPWVTDQDRLIISSVKVTGSSYYRDYRIDEERLIPALDGHPALILRPDDTPVEVQVISPSLKITGGQDSDFKIVIDPPLPDYGIIKVTEPIPGRLQIYFYDKSIRDIIGSIGNGGISVPKAAKDRVQRIANSLSAKIPLQTDLATSIETEMLKADLTIVFQMQMREAFVDVLVAIRPLGPNGPIVLPGRGARNMTFRMDGKLVQTQRDPDEEGLLAQNLVDAIPTLSNLQSEDTPWQWVLDISEALELLSACHDMGDKCRIEWQGERSVRIKAKAQHSSVNGQIKQGQDWFSLSGEVKIDEDMTFSIQAFLELLNTSQGRFITLDDGNYLEVSEDLKRRLADLAALSDVRKDELRFHPSMVPALETTVEEIKGIQKDKKFRECIASYTKALGSNPEVPSTLTADLRGYQVEGYQWMMRLADAGFGACLADDMGLGKTVQALAVLVARASKGPALIIAPTSVCPNWESETRKFAPTLKVKVLSEGSDRKNLIKRAKAFDLVIVSYGLLHLEGELLASRPWGTLVMDEAQAIKNMATKRAQAATKIDADFRLLMSGTPVENHLGELWSLFRVINPGLLGSHEKFNRRFMGPISRLEDRSVLNRLKKLISPFLLRRTKNAVLDDLPSRTSITLSIEPTNEELAFYDALRRRALESVSTPGSDSRMKILAELMRLRRACCNPELVTPGVGISSAKLEEFKRLIGELLDNKHKCLVFSQFVDHLTILRHALDEMKVSYQYLDGSTPVGQRKKRVEAFQSGEGDVFLISLKAGGSGLNLTAADYVIHMDPWWNPAVEDQASDRAHRIGQQRPVTIYRMIMKGTIEEKIVALHDEKRDLADGLLEGSESAKALSVDELLSLLYI